MVGWIKRDSFRQLLSGFFLMAVIIFFSFPASIKRRSQAWGTFQEANAT